METEMLTAAEARRQAEDLARLLDTANAPIFGIDVEGRVNEWNQKTAATLGWSKIEACGRDLVETFIAPDYRRDVKEVLDKALRGEESANFEFPIFTPDGKRREILLNATTRRGADGEVVGVMGVGQDITELRAITAEQENVADDLGRLIENANAPIFGVNIDGLVTVWNRKAAELSGFTAEETMHRPLVEEFITEEYKPSVQDVLNKACQGVEADNFEFPLVTKDGKRIDILLNATTRRDASGEVIGVVGVGQDITTLRKSMKMMGLIADDLTRLIDTANAPIFGIDTDFLVTEWNQKAAEISGWEKNETAGRHLVESFIHQDYQAEVKQVLADALAGKETANYEFPLFIKDGSRREILLNATTRRGVSGEIVGVIGVGQDITALRAMTSEQQRVASDFYRMIETANAPIFGVDMHGRVTEWNKKAEQVSGHCADETMGHMLVEEFITSEYKQKVHEVLLRAMSGVETDNFEFPLLTKDGRRIDILLNATTRRDEKGEVTGVVGVGQDITKLREAMNESARTAGDLMRLIDTANAPIFGIDPDGKVTEWNQKAVSISGYTKEETLGKPLVETFISVEYRQDVHTVLSKALEGDETANFEFPLFTKTGQRREILLNATRLYDSYGRTTGVIGVGQDITELRMITAEQHHIADDLQRLIETANAPIFGVSVDGRVTEWNRKAAKISGFEKHETMGRPLVDKFITEEYKSKVQVVLSRACIGLETANFELPLVTKDGKHVVILLNATTRRDASGLVTGVVGVGQEITYLRQAMNEAKLVADDLMRLIDTANAPIFGIDTEGCVSEWNQMAASISGWDREDTMGKPLVESFISLEYRVEVSRVLAKALAGEDTSNFEFPLFTSNGQRIEILLNATTRRGADGEVTGVIGVGQDITELRAITMEQHRIADDLVRLIETANAPIFGVSVGGHVNEWNRKAAELSGYSRAETMGRPLVEDFITSDYKEKVQAVLTNACQGQEVANFEFPLVTKSGARINILLNATPRTDAKGQVTGVVGVGQDITELRRALDENYSIAEDLTRLIDTANAPIFGIDHGGNVKEWNQMAAAISGWAKADTHGKPLVESFISAEYRDEVGRVLKSALQGNETANFEFPLFTKDGRRREILLNATTRRGRKGEITGVIGVGQDITELRSILVEQHRIADDLSRLIDTANAPIFGASIGGLVNEWNRKTFELTGYSKEETMDRPLVKSFIGEEYQSSVQAVLTRACNGVETANFEFPLTTKDGRKIFILMNAATRRDANGQSVGVVGVGQDITELKEALSNSRTVADDLARLIDTANAPIFGINTEGKVTEWNRMASKITRFNKQMVLGKPMVENFIHMEERSRVQEVFDTALNGQEVANFQLPLCTKTGERREILLNATARRGPEGEIIGLVGVGQDVTELNIQRRESERIAADLARLIDTANAPIFGVDVQGCVQEWNRKAAELSGWTKDEIQGQRIVQTLVAPECQHQVSYVLLRALGGEESSDFAFPLVTKAGEQREVLMNATALRAANGDVSGVIGVGHDVTELKKMAAEQKQIADDLARLIRSANAPIFGVNTKGEVTEWNDMAASLSGYTRDEALGKQLVQTFIREQFREGVGRAITDACRGIETTNFEFPLIHRNGSEVLVLLNAATRRDASSNIIGMVGVGQDITTLRQAMNEISSSADDLRRIVEHANAPILGIDTEGRVTDWNQKVSELSQFSRAEMLGKHLVETFIHEEYRKDVWAVLKNALEGKETDNYEFPLFTKSGSRHEILFNATTRRGADGKVTGVIGVGQDITKLRSITQEHESIADDLQRLIETANAPIFGVDTEGHITEWNRKAVEVSGFSKRDTCGQSLVKHFIHRMHRQPVQAVLDQALQAQMVGNFELKLYTRSGEQRDILLNATPRLGRQGEVVGVVCVGQDITELNKHRQEIERIAEDLSQLIDTANAPIFGVDRNLSVNEWNGWVAKNSGFQRDEVRGSHLTEYIAKDSRDLVVKVINAACAGKLTSKFEVEMMVRHEKRNVCLLLNATPRVNRQGDIVGVICVGQDITSIKDIEQKKASFMAMVSHELKSPLHGIIGLSSSLSASEDIAENIQRPLQLIHSCAMRLLDMVSNIMDASILVKDKKMRFSRDEVQMSSIIEEVLLLCKHAIDKRGRPITKETVELINDVKNKSLPQIEADAHRCTQVIYNLVTNALKFTHKGFVRVDASFDDDEQKLTVSVRDTGIGIAQESLQRIFQPFDQEDQSETRRYDGLGLGLAICWEVVVRHGGELTVESVKGEGSAFNVILPYVMQHQDDSKKEEKEQEHVQIDCEEISECEQSPLTRPVPATTNPSDGLLNCEWSTCQQMDPLPGEEQETSNDGKVGTRYSFQDEPITKSGELKECVPEHPAGERYTIFSVDDDEVNQEATCTALQKCNYNVVVAMSGEACFRYMKERESPPDLILLDVMMPGISGMDVLVQIRKTYSLTELPIIMVSTKDSPRDIVKGLSLQCNDWVSKPFDCMELISRVNVQIAMKKLFTAQGEKSWPLHRLSRMLPQTAIQHLEYCRHMPDALLPMLQLQTGSDHQQWSRQGTPRTASHAVATPSADGEMLPASSEWRIKFEPVAAEITEAKRKLEQKQSELDRYQKTAEQEAMRLRNECIEAKQKLEQIHTEVDQGRNKVKHSQIEVVGLEQRLSACKKKEEELKDERVRLIAQKEQLEEVCHHLEEQLRNDQRETAELREALREKHCSTGCATAAVADIDQSWQEERSFTSLLHHQNAHLALTVASRERQLSELTVTLQQQVLCTELAQQRCGQLELLIRRLTVDARMQPGVFFQS